MTEEEADRGYRLPPQAVVDILDTPPTPVLTLSPDRRTMMLVEYQAYPSIELLARPFLKLGGIRVDPQLSATQRTIEYTGLTLLDVADATQRPVTGLPDGAKIGVPSWSLDSRRFAFTRDTESGVEVWVGDTETAACRPLTGFHTTDVLAGPFAWLDDSRHLLVASVPVDRGAPPEEPGIPSGPIIQETAGKQVRASTYQDLLQSPHEERLFAYYGTSQLILVDTDTGAILPLGNPDLLLSVAPSPSEDYLLVTRLKRPFSYRVPYFYFSRTIEVWDRAGRTVRVIADHPVSDEVPQQGVPTGPRSVLWQAKHPATLLWAEALDGGDPLAKVPHRDRLLRLAAPFEEEPTELLRLNERYAGWDWTDRPDEVLLGEYHRDRRWRTTYRLSLNRPDEKTTLFDLSVNDAYNDPGSFVYRMNPDGERVMLQDGDDAYLTGRGATPEGDRPFLDRIHLPTGERTRLFECDPDSYSGFVAFVGPENDRDEIMISHQTPTRPTNYFVLNLATGERRALTDFTDPHPQLTGLKKELVRYTRADGVPLSGRLYLPPGYDPERDGPLPLILWAYPMEYSDAATAGQVRGSDRTFTRMAGTSQLWFVTQGYAVLNDATMPVVGDPETMNDTFVEQIVGAAEAAIAEMVRRGIADPTRVVVGGHSYGAFMTANLLAHAPERFAAGIARSGAYNRTLTPFGFQSERRSFWEAREIYMNLSPFTHADRIKSPILLIHGQNDNNPGTHTLQSERFYQALQATGATARLVLLPHESHGYRARESVLHTLYEMFSWADRYAKNR
ncbi:MAG: prolyl oligopeptidase family serine peptidase [Capsulimonadales bacterium]|nr:prolyl oligopeptidase family serine peptidase [Capsulimonadales bacterium]